MNLREQFESELKSTGVKLLFESGDVNYIKWLEDKNKELTEQLRIGGVGSQREQLLLFKQWEQKTYWKPNDGDAELTVDTYLKSN